MFACCTTDSFDRNFGHQGFHHNRPALAAYFPDQIRVGDDPGDVSLVVHDYHAL
jgi:hypothetical protein